MNIEKGVKIEGYSDYLIFPEEGKIWSLKRNRFIGAQQPTGYWYVTLTDDDGEVHPFYLHRLIWFAVYGEIPDGLQVNHIDEDKSNCSIFNLNLMSRKENCNWGSRNSTIAEKLSQKVGAYKDGLLVKVFPSASEAGRQLGCNKGCISQCCKGERKSHKGFTWRYAS